jgi:hypothetical protein
VKRYDIVNGTLDHAFLEYYFQNWSQLFRYLSGCFP